MSEKKHPKPDNSWWGRTRDKIAFHIARFVFNHVATKWYSAMIEGSIRLGLDAARQEAKACAPTVSLAWLQAQAERSDATAKVRSADTTNRPATCCGACPPLKRGGFDCTCAGNPRCRLTADVDGKDHAKT